MNSLYLLILVFIVLSFNQCDTNSRELKVKVVKQTFLPELPSASGIEFYNESTLLVGDDSPWLFVLDKNNKIIDKVKISSIDTLVKNRTPKTLKADFEAMEKVKTNLKENFLIVSSGSSKPTRDTAYLISLGDNREVRKRNLRPVFEKIKQIAQISGEDEINIEGLAVDQKNSYMFHRGNVSGNFIAVLNTGQLLNYITTTADQLPDVSVVKFNLPVYKGLKSGFSGACISEDGKKILFTASLEETSDVINDGKVLGSYIGIIELDKLHEGKYRAVLVEQDGEILAKKLEGISLRSASENTMNVSVACDNDDGSSDLFEMEIEY